MAMTIKQAVQLASSPEVLETSSIEVVQEVVDTITASTDKRAKKRLDIVKGVLANMKKASGADTEKIEAIENSVKKIRPKKKPAKATPAKEETAEPIAEAKDEEDFGNMTIAELKKILDGMGKTYKARETKTNLIALIEAPVEVAEEPVVAEEPEEGSEEEMHLQLANLIDESTPAELRAIAKDHSLTIPAKLKKPSLIRQFLKDNIIGYDVQGIGEEDKEVEKEVVREETSPFPAEFDGRVKVTVKQLKTAIVDSPYQVVAYIMEKGQDQPTPFLVTYANDEVVVLLDLGVQVNSVLSLEIKNHIVGDKAKIDNVLCPMAFYAPPAK